MCIVVYRAAPVQVARAGVETWDYNIDGAVQQMKFEHFIFVLKYLLYFGVLLFSPHVNVQNVWSIVFPMYTKQNS